MEIEDIVKGLKCIKGEIIYCKDCRYSGEDGFGRGKKCHADVINDAIELIASQEREISHWKQLQKQTCDNLKKFVFKENPYRMTDDLYFGRR